MQKTWFYMKTILKTLSKKENVSTNSVSYRIQNWHKNSVAFLCSNNQLSEEERK